jgi:hypothetical protein
MDVIDIKDINKQYSCPCVSYEGIWELEVWLHAISTFTPSGIEWSALPSWKVLFVSSEKCWVGLRAILYVVEKTKFSHPCQESNHNASVVKPLSETLYQYANLGLLLDMFNNNNNNNSDVCTINRNNTMAATLYSLGT